MAKSPPIRTVDEFIAFVRTDPHAGCPDCKSAFADAHHTAIAFGQWWLSDEQRAHWGVATHVVPNPGDKMPKIGLSFRIETPTFPKGLPILLVLFQHWKSDPHYQLQIPSPDMLLSIKDDTTRYQVEDVWNRYSRSADVFRSTGKKSISLHRAFTDKTRDTLFALASRVVEDLKGIQPGEG